jgi:hypothetical protein
MPRTYSTIILKNLSELNNKTYLNEPNEALDMCLHIGFKQHFNKICYRDGVFFEDDLIYCLKKAFVFSVIRRNLRRCILSELISEKLNSYAIPSSENTENIVVDLNFSIGIYAFYMRAIKKYNIPSIYVNDDSIEVDQRILDFFKTDISSFEKNLKFDKINEDCILNINDFNQKYKEEIMNNMFIKYFNTHTQLLHNIFIKNNY